MDIETILPYALLTGVFLVLFFLLLRREIHAKRQDPDQAAVIEWLKSMQVSIDATNRSLSDAMRGSATDMGRVLQAHSRQLNERLDTAASVIGELKRHVGEMSEIGKGIRSLQEILQSPKLRGNIGEEVLSEMIGQAFPKRSFHLQYAFASGAKVDAILKTEAGLLPIDAKFPMENFTKMHSGKTEEDRKKSKKEFIADVKKHITDISRKYILPEEGTVDFALMYIPSEAVYYDTVNLTDITDVARANRVYPVSPNTLYAQLQVLLLSFQGREFEERSREVIKIFRGIQKDYVKIGDQLSVTGKHLVNATNSFHGVTAVFDDMGRKLERTKEFGEGESQAGRR